jgi:glycosyltransferase involved in cell wall biosynthesis
LTAVTAWKTSAPGVRAHAFQLIYLVQACFLARRLGQLGVVHLHNHIAMNSATVAMLASSLSGVPWSMTVHGPHDFIEPYRWALPQKIASAGFSVFIAEFGRSQAMMLVESALWPRMHVVRCGLDESFLQFPRTRITNDAGLVFVGRLAPEKGVLLLLEAVARLVPEGICPRLVLIGDGPSRPEVEAYIARQNLNSAVDLLGWQGADRVRAEILASRALVLPSFAEGLPIVIMEALALHRAVVSTYVAGIPELVEDGVSGLLVPAGSTDALVDAIRRIATADTELLDSWGDAGSNAVKARHDGEKSVDRLESLFLRSASGR